jgi:RimJ/RimL family protein N-acetyltransferase
MTETARAVVMAVLADRLLYRVEAGHHAQHTASGRVMETSGMAS